MKLTLTTLQLKILKHASEGNDFTQLTEESGLSNKQLGHEVKSVCTKLHAKNPLEALQNLAKTEFVVID